MLGQQVGKMLTYDRTVHIVFLSVGKAIIIAGLLCTISPDVSASPSGNELVLRCNASIRQAEGERLTEEEKLWSILCLSYLEAFSTPTQLKRWDAKNRYIVFRSKTLQ